MPTLRELKAVLVRYEEREEDRDRATMPLSTEAEIAAWIAAGRPSHVVRAMCAYHVKVRSLAKANGVRFLCPLCFARNGGERGTHMVVCWSRSRGTPEHATPGPGRWRIDGTSLDDLSLMEEPGQTRSVALIGGCAWHGYVTNGIAE